ncbi:MAG: hypothetical protein ABIE70_11590 [bacterium]
MVDKIPFNAYDFFGYLAPGAIACVSLDYVLGLGIVLVKDPGAYFTVLIVMAFYFVGHVVAAGSALVYGRVVARIVYGDYYEYLFSDDRMTMWRRLTACAPLPAEIQTAVLKQARGVAIEKAGQALYQFACSVARRSPEYGPRLRVFLNLLGFSRNVSAAFAVAGIAFALSSYGGGGSTSIGWMTAAALFASAVMLVRFMRFYRLYGVEVFSALAYHDDRKDDAAC